MHQSTWDLRHSIGIDVPFRCTKLKKVVGANFEKIDKADFHDRQTGESDLIGPLIYRGPKTKKLLSPNYSTPPPLKIQRESLFL